MPGQLAIIADAGYRKRRLTVANGNTISKGILLTLNDPRTAIACTSANAAAAVSAAGISGSVKEASDGSTSLDVYYDCVAEVTASGAINKGNPIVFINDNYIAAAPIPGTASGAIVAGYAMETASDNEVISARINL